MRAAGMLHQPDVRRPHWGLYADECWRGWPGVILDWPDFGLPADYTEAISGIAEAFARARSRQDVLIGCRGGTGRTGTILAGVAILAGVPASLAVEWVRDRYHPGAVDTPAQEDWVVSHFARADLARKEAVRSRGRLVKAALDPIRNAMWEALHEPEHAPVLAWAVPDVLAITQRPLRTHPVFGGSARSYPAEARPAIEQWLRRLVEQSIRSVIVLTSKKELAHYETPTAPEGGVASHPWCKRRRTRTPCRASYAAVVTGSRISSITSSTSGGLSS